MTPPASAWRTSANQRKFLPIQKLHQTRTLRPLKTLKRPYWSLAMFGTLIPSTYL